MILQNIQLPKDDICDKYDMYFHREGEVFYLKEGEVEFNKGGVCVLDTYFNGISIDKWKKYTNIGKITAKIRLKGRFKVWTGYVYRVSPTDIRRIITYRTVVESDGRTELTIPFEDGRGMLYMQMEALSDTGVFYGGTYNTEVESERNVRIGIGICTFKREEFITKNIGILNERVFENSSSMLNGHLEVFISDNGKTLDVDRLSSEHIHMFRNKNTGGAGGFTRTLIEMWSGNKEYKLTHALLMDDDILLDVGALERTYRILSIVKDEYIGTFIGGAMLRNDNKDVQEEAGASWNAGKLISYKKGLQLLDTEPCLYNESEERYEFNAWWYCCFPMTVVNDKNLPLPIFIRGDDLEYGLRNMKNLILMNGICVWHEPFENKYSSFLNYYITRNMFIDNAFHFPDYGAGDAVKDFSLLALREILLYRYKNARLLMRGVEDFLKGVDFFLETDGEKLHKEIMSGGYRMEDPEKLGRKVYLRDYEETLFKDDSRTHKIIRALNMNGHWAPVKKDTVTVSMSQVNTSNNYRVREVINYDIISGKIFITKKDNKEMFSCLIKFIGLRIKLRLKYNKAKNDFISRGDELKSLDFWKKYLELD